MDIRGIIEVLLAILIPLGFVVLFAAVLRLF